MIDRLRSRPGGNGVGVHQADLADFDLPRHDYAVSVRAVSTLFMLSHVEQCTAIRSAGRHLRSGGQLFIEAFQLDPSRIDADGRRVETRASGVGPHVVRSRHEPVGRSIRIRHELSADDGV